MDLLDRGTTHESNASKAVKRRIWQIRASTTHGLVIVARPLAPAKY